MMWSDSDGLRQYEQMSGRSSGSLELTAVALNSVEAAAADTSPRPNVPKKWRMRCCPRVNIVSATNGVVVEEVSSTRYLWERARRTSRSARVAWCASLAALVLLIVLLAVTLRQEPQHGKPEEPIQPEETTHSDETKPPGEPSQPDETTPPGEPSQPDKTTPSGEATQPDENAPPEETTQPYETTSPGETTQPVEPNVPHEWNITRRMWGANPEIAVNYDWVEELLPLRLVIVHHTIGPECHWFLDCSIVLQSLQRYYFATLFYDLPYNYFVGNDGRVYEGRGWTGQSAHTRGYNRCALGVGFTGDYRYGFGNSRATAQQLNRTHMMLQRGVSDGLIHENYLVLAASDVASIDSPGNNLYEALRELPHFVADTQRYRDRTCEDIYAELQAIEDGSRAIIDANDTALPSL